MVLNLPRKHVGGIFRMHCIVASLVGVVTLMVLRLRNETESSVTFVKQASQVANVKKTL